jgi:hypothetical protein
MKKIIFILALAIPLMAGIIFTGYRSSTQKQKAAQAKDPYANRDLNAAPKLANTVAEKPINSEEWLTFKSESERKIRNHEIRIAELNLEIKNQGEKSDALYRKKIANLEQQNKDMRARLEAYEKSQSNWESFKREFNHDMDAIGQALKDLTVDNKK